MTERKLVSLFMFTYAITQMLLALLWYFRVIGATPVVLMVIGHFIILPVAIKFYILEKK